MLIRLLLGFLAVIVLLVSFNYLSFTFFQSNIRGEIIRYNAQNIRFTSDRYEEHFQLVQKQMYALYFNDEMSGLLMSTGNARFQLLDRIKQEIVKVVSNPLIYVDNAIVVFQDPTLTLSRTGTNDRVSLFEKFYASPEYPDAFWQQQFQETYTSKIFPMASFREHAFYQSGEAMPKGQFIPYINKHWQNNDFYLVAMLDAGKLFRAFHRSVNANFIIYDEAKRPIYSTTGQTDLQRIPQLTGDDTYVLKDNTYYFYRKGEFTGFTYLNIVPGASISEQVSRLNLTLILLLLLALTVSVVLSVWFSMRFHKPVKMMVSTIQKPLGGQEGLFKSKIREFELIGRKLEDMLTTNAKIQLDLEHKDNQLASFGYLNKLKNIHNGSRGAVDSMLLQVNRFIIYEITYKDRFWEEMKEEPGPLTYCIYEFINTGIRQVFPTALTLQVESRQMLTVLDDTDETRLTAYIEELLQVLSHDKDYYFFTIAISPAFPPQTDVTVAYEQTVKLLQQRKLKESTQVVRETAGRPAGHLFPPAQEQQFDSNLAAGNTQELLQLLDRHLALMERKCATVQQYQEFVVEIVQKVRKTLHALRLDDEAIEPVLTGLRTGESFYAGRHYRRFFSRLLVAACEEIRGQRKNADPTIDFVLHYIEQHYAEDLTLEIVAEHLPITAGYLSTVFKEKTGEYFVDYVNGVRIREAQRMLLETDLRVQDIAVRAGYQNVNSFNRMFKKWSGMSPREFRKEQLAGAVPVEE